MAFSVDSQEEKTLIDKDTILNQDIAGSIEITADNITLDCNGHAVTGSGTGQGIYLNNKKYIIIKNCTISQFSIGIDLRSSSNISIINNNLSLNSHICIYIYSGGNNIIENNNIFSNRLGINLRGSSKNKIINNKISNSDTNGIHLTDSPSNEIKNNEILSNNVGGIELSWSSGNVISDNEIENNYRGIILGRSTQDTITKNNINSSSKDGIYLYETHFNTIFLNNFEDNTNNVFFYSSDRNNWNSPETITYNHNGNSFTNYLGNYWGGYAGEDADNNGIGDTPYPYSGIDSYPLMVFFENYISPPEAEKWSFAVITDLHIGWGIPDYNSEGYNGTTIGQDYYITKKLKEVIQWINENYKNPDYNIKFVAVTGDISDTAEYSEFITAREILNELEIPYLPVIGNHDIWPYIQKTTTNPDDRFFSIKDKRKNGEPLGDEYFEEVFWRDNPTNTEKIRNFFASFERQEELSGYSGVPYFQNYAFSYDGTKFITLDFASRDYWELMMPINASSYSETMDWFKKKLENCDEEKTLVLTHYPFIWEGGFKPLDMKSVQDLIVNSKCKVLNIAGHTHINSIADPNNKYIVVETEPTSQIPLSNPLRSLYTLKGEFLRLIKINSDNTNEINYETLIDGFSKAINPYFTISPGEVSIDEEIIFKAYTKNKKPNEISSYHWEFEDGPVVNTKDPEFSKIYRNPGSYKASLTVTDVYGNSEELSWDIKVKEEAKKTFKIFLPISGLTSFLNGGDTDLTKVGQNTAEWSNIVEISSPAKPVGALQIHFEKAFGDIDLSNLVAGADLENRKSVFYMANWPEIIEEEKILYVPSTGAGSVYVCPKAVSLEEVNPQCEDMKILNVGETKDGMMMMLTNYNDREYYMIYGVKGTGGGEIGEGEAKLENQITIMEMEYGETNILDEVTNQIGDGVPPLLLSELTTATIDLEDFTMEGKINSGEKKRLKMKFKFSETAGNEYQGKSIDVKFNFKATQEEQ